MYFESECFERRVFSSLHVFAYKRAYNIATYCVAFMCWTKKKTYMIVDFMQFNICSLTFESLNAMGANVMDANAMGTRE